MWLSSYLLVLLFFEGVVTLASITLPPRLTTPEQTIRVKEGQTKVHLECNLEVGDDPMSYQWMKLYKLVTADLGFAYRTHKKVHLALHPITPEHAGTYECVATNAAGADATKIEVIVESDDFYRSVLANHELPDTSDILSELAASLNDLLAEGDCSCDIMFLMHVSPDAPPETVAAQANFVYTVAAPIISPIIRIAAATFSDYLNFKLSFGKGVNQCALENALKSLDHKKWATRIQGVLRDVLKKFRKSKNQCKVLFFPIFGSLGTEGANAIVSKHLKKLGVKILILEVTPSPLAGVQEMASQRGDGKPYHWWIPIKIWSTIVSYMAYIPEELSECMANKRDIDGVCVGEGMNCTKSSQCQGVGTGCVQGVCTSLQCNEKPNLPGCCSSPEDSFWCGDVTRSCQSSDAHCNGVLQCMNGHDEEMCFDIPCGKDEGRCQSSTRCLSLYDLCDGEPHCPRAEDEDPKVCRSFPCPTDRLFRCRNGKCISTDRLCDGTFRDCANGEDENLEYCSERHVCPPTRPFKCDYGICMPEKMVCDGAFNCLDALDERLCEERNCPAKRPFKCGDGTCVELALVCNGLDDACDDGLDEYNCTAFVCPSGRSFKCMNGKCIDDQLACNKNDDCGDGTDEANCDSPHSTTYTPTPTKVLCRENEFLCESGVCLSSSKVCDGRRNCLEGEDENEDLCRNYPCPPERSFRCPDGACVHAKLCDGVSDCADAFDELDCVIESTPNYTYEDEDDEEIKVDHPSPNSAINDHHGQGTFIEDVSDDFDDTNVEVATQSPDMTSKAAEHLPQDSSLDDGESKSIMDTGFESEKSNGGNGMSGTTSLLFSVTLSFIAFYQTPTLSLR